MKIIEPSAQIEHVTPNALQIIEWAGRTCYKSEDRITEGSAEEFAKRLITRDHVSVLEHASMTVRFIVDRGVSHELVRHRIASFSQESTRYCNYSKGKFGREITVIRPIFWSDDKVEFRIWQEACQAAEKAYFELIDWGCAPQEARSVLPNSLKTEIVVTANLREWREIFRQRTSSAAHPQMREVMRPLLSAARQAVPVVFDDAGDL